MSAEAERRHSAIADALRKVARTPLRGVRGDELDVHPDDMRDLECEKREPTVEVVSRATGRTIGTPRNRHERRAARAAR